MSRGCIIGLICVGCSAVDSSSSSSVPAGLTPEEREVGQRRFRKYQTLNGISVAFLMENMLILYAIRNGMSDSLVAILASFVHLTMPFMFFGKRLIVRRGLARTWGLCWFLRYVSIVGIVVAPYFAETTAWWLTPAIILAGTFGFTVFRAMGLTAGTPLVGEITTDHDRGRYISGNVVRGRVAYFCAMIAAVLLLRFTDATWAYQLIIIAGCGVGMVASRILASVPESNAGRVSARKPVGESFRELFGKKSRLRLVIGWCCGFISYALVIPYSVIAIKNGYGLNDEIALVYSVLIIAGGILSSLLNGILADHVGPRPLLILYGIGIWLCALFWSLAPPVLLPFVVGFVFLAAGFCKVGILINLGHYFLSLVDESERVGLNLFVRMLSGAAAGLASSVIGASLLELLQRSPGNGMGVYRTYFAVIVVILIPVVLGLYRIERLREWKVRDIVGLMFSPRDLRALFVMNRLSAARTFEEEEQHVDSLGAIGSHVSEEAIREYLSSPQLSVRTQALRALWQIEFGSETADAVLEQLRIGEYTTAPIAAEILANHRIRRAVPELRRCLDSQDPYLVGTAMVGLAQLQDEKSYPRIRVIFQDASNPGLIIRGAQALARIGDSRDVDLLLTKTVQSLPDAVVDEVLAATATLTGCAAKFYHLVTEYSRSTDHGVSYLLSSFDGSVVEAGRFRREVSSHKSMPYVKRVLTEIAEASPAVYADSILAFLRRLDGDVLPPKVALCVALSLSSPPKPDRTLATADE